MQRTRSHPSSPAHPSSRQPLRWLVATVLLALAGGLVQTVSAAPRGPQDGHAGMPAMNHMSQSQMSDLDGMVMAHPRQMDRLLDGIQATPEQRVQLKQIAQDARTDLRAQREAGQALREQGRALFAQPTVDEAAAEALRQQWLARHDRASQRMMQALLEMSRVLTPDQRQAMTALMAERRDRMERQRAERASAAGTKR